MLLRQRLMNIMNKSVTDKKCYVRFDHNCWIEARPHQDKALEIYLNSFEPGYISTEKIVRTPHSCGGYFVGNFSHVGGHVYKYIDESGNKVDIMMETPEKVAYINRLTT